MATESRALSQLVKHVMTICVDQSCSHCLQPKNNCLKVHQPFPLSKVWIIILWPSTSCQKDQAFWFTRVQFQKRLSLLVLNSVIWKKIPGRWRATNLCGATETECGDDPVKAEEKHLLYRKKKTQLPNSGFSTTHCHVLYMERERKQTNENYTNSVM